jgi:hypothetical protein
VCAEMGRGADAGAQQHQGGGNAAGAEHDLRVGSGEL